MNYKDFDFYKMERSVNEHQQRMAEIAKAQAEYQAQQDAAAFETRDLLQKIQEESSRESRINTRRFIIQTVVSVVALIAAVVAAVAALIPLL